MVTPFNQVTTSCISSRIVPLNVDKDGRMFCGGFWKKSVSYNTYSSDSSFWTLNGFVCCFFNKCWYLWRRRRDGKRHSLPLVEAMKQMTQNWTFHSPRISESAKIASKWRVCSSYFICPLCVYRKCPYSPHRRDWNFLRGGGFCKAKKIKEMYEA